MIEINGKVFLPNIKSSLGVTEMRGKPVSGLYKLKKNGVMLYSPAGDVEVFVVGNRYNEFFFVSAFTFEGKTRYSFDTTKQHEEWLGLDKLGFCEQCDLAKKTVTQLREMKVAA